MNVRLGRPVMENKELGILRKYALLCSYFNKGRAKLCHKEDQYLLSATYFEIVRITMTFLSRCVMDKCENVNVFFEPTVKKHQGFI